MAHAEKCLVCGGRGKVPPEGPWGGGPDSYPTCHGCQGRGWVTVEDTPRVCPAPLPIPIWIPPSQYYWPTYLPYPYRPYEIICTTTTMGAGTIGPIAETPQGSAAGWEPR